VNRVARKFPKKQETTACGRQIFSVEDGVALRLERPLSTSK
jgi:hypothetical protein